MAEIALPPCSRKETNAKSGGWGGLEGVGEKQTPEGTCAGQPWECSVDTLGLMLMPDSCAGAVFRQGPRSLGKRTNVAKKRPVCFGRYEVPRQYSEEIFCKPTCVRFSGRPG